MRLSFAPSGAPTIALWLLPRAELTAALGRELGGRPVERDPAGKPFTPGGPHFNVSHSGALALLGICAAVPIGVDLEQVRPLRNPAGLARRMAAPAELDHLAGIGEPTSVAYAAELLRLWVRKEAVAKAEGGGLVTALSGIDVLGDRAQVRGGGFGLADLPEPAPGYRGAVAWAVHHP